MKLMKRLVSILAATLLAWSVCLAQNGAISTVAQKYSEGDFATALKLATSLASQEPGNDAAWYYAAMARMALEQKGYIFKGDGVEYMKKAIQLDSTNYWYCDRLAVFYLMRGENELATAEYEKLARDFPRKTDAYYQLVNLYLREGNNAVDIRRLDRKAFRIHSDTTIAGQCVDPVYADILSQFFYNGVLTAASADYQNIHPMRSFRFIFPYQ